MDRHIEYLKEHPEDMEWLKRKLRSRFYDNLLAQIEARPREKEEDEKETMSRENRIYLLCDFNYVRHR